jgi:hypothetical protein
MRKKQFFLETPTGHFYSVELYPSEKDMFRAIELLGGREADPDARALCLRYVAEARNAKNKLYVTPEIGTLFFLWSDRNNREVVAHELMHAVVGYFNRTKRNLQDHEETSAEIMQSFFRQFETKLKKRPAKQPA